MEPVSAIIGIASGAAGLLALTSQVVGYLVELRDRHENARLTVLDLIATFKAYEAAWAQIQQWALQASNAPLAGDSESLIAQIESYLEVGKAMMDIIESDLDRASASSKRGLWARMGGKPRGKDAIYLLLHHKLLREHGDRIHRQSTSLNLLISVLTLPSQPVQEAAIEVLRPKFRKDEETAWTIVNSKLSPVSRMPESTVATSTRSGIGSMVSIISQRCGISNSFSFEDELFSGPVYRRLLITKLCEQPMSYSGANHDLRISTRQGGEGRELLRDQSNHDDNTLALELRQQGIFSRSYHEDYLEFMACHRPRKLERRHMPLAAILCQEARDQDEQTRIDNEYCKAVVQGDLSRVADALDQGADINCRRNGRTALEFCIFKWLDSKAAYPDSPSEDTTIAEFLMLYKETHIPYNFRGEVSILHVCMHIGATAKFMRPIFEVEGTMNAIKQRDKYGRPVLHCAVLSSTAGLFALQQLRQLFGDGGLQSNNIRNKNGHNVHEFAIIERAFEHIVVLNKIGNNQGPRLLFDLSKIGDVGEGSKDPTTETTSRMATLHETSHESSEMSLVSNLSLITSLERESLESSSDEGTSPVSVQWLHCEDDGHRETLRVANFSEQESNEITSLKSQIERLLHRRTL